MNERELFITAWLEHVTSVTQLCKRFYISRNTGYKWIERFKAEGMTGLADRSRARLTQSHRTPEAVVEKILQLELKGTLPVASPLYVKTISEGAAEPSCPIGTVHVRAIEERNSAAE